MRVFLWGFGLFAFATSAHATQGQRYGLDAGSAARAALSVADGTGAFAAANNPALLATNDRSEMGFGFLSSSLEFENVGPVLVDSPRFRTQTGLQRTAELSPPNAGMTAGSLGVSLRPMRLFQRRLGLGLAMSTPFDTLRSFRSSTPYDFQTLRYGTADRQFQGTLGLGYEVIPGSLFLGVAGQMYIVGAGAAEAAINADNPTGRFAMDVGMRVGLRTGALYRLGDRTAIGVGFRQRLRPALKESFLGSVELAGAEVIVQPMELAAVLYAEPETWDTHLTHDFGGFRANLGVRWERWSHAQPSYLMVGATRPDGSVARTLVEPAILRDVWSPATSVAVPIGSFTVSAGYRWQPTALGDTSGQTNLLDGDIHLATIGVEHSWTPGEFIPGAVRWGLALQRHWLIGRNVLKSDPGFIGAPGYRVRANGFAAAGHVAVDL